jgi:hypothetical protein
MMRKGVLQMRVAITGRTVKGTVPVSDLFIAKRIIDGLEHG